MQNNPLKIISLNIEMDRHFDRIIPFFKKQQPDIILLQEVLEKDLTYLKRSTGMTGPYTTQNIFTSENSTSPIGLLTLTNLPIINHHSVFYRGDGVNPIPMTVNEPEKMARALSIIEIQKGEQFYCLGNTHFTWTPDAKPNADQYQDVERLLSGLQDIPEFILCGDFNAPRGGAIYDTIALNYKDNIPSYITTTIDKKLHRRGDLNIVVDSVFTTPSYEVIDIQIVDNLSDHCAIIATIKSPDVLKK